MDKPDIIAELHRVNDAEGITGIAQHYFQHAGAESLRRLGNIGLSAFSCDGECGEANGLRLGRKLPEIPKRRLEPRDGTCFAGFRYSSVHTAHISMLSSLTKGVKPPMNLTSKQERDSYRAFPTWTFHNNDDMVEIQRAQYPGFIPLTESASEIFKKNHSMLAKPTVAAIVIEQAIKRAQPLTH